jgi:hypothetical protein
MCHSRDGPREYYTKGKQATDKGKYYMIPPTCELSKTIERK